MAQELVSATADPMKMAAPTMSLAPGFRFHPTDEELVGFYLRQKVCGKRIRFEAVSEINVYKFEPWELSEFSSLKSRDVEYYFFSPVDRKYDNGSQLNRATGQGFWKNTGKDRPVCHQSQIIGMKKTLVYYTGRALHGKRTNWVMHEYRLADEELGKAGVPQDAFVLCRIFDKSGDRPANGDGAALLVPGGEAEEEMADGDETHLGGNNLEQVQGNVTEGTQTLDLFSISGACPIGATDARGTQAEPKENEHANPRPFGSSDLEKSVPPGCLESVSNLQSEISRVSKERDALKTEMMRAQSIMNVMLSRIELLENENDDFKRRVCGGHAVFFGKSRLKTKDMEWYFLVC